MYALKVDILNKLYHCENEEQLKKVAEIINVKEFCIDKPGVYKNADGEIVNFPWVINEDTPCGIFITRVPGEDVAHNFQKNGMPTREGISPVVEFVSTCYDFNAKEAI